MAVIIRNFYLNKTCFFFRKKAKAPHKNNAEYFKETIFEESEKVKD
jgi:hypothetical protein